MEGLAAGLNALRHDGGGKVEVMSGKDRGYVWKGLKECSPCSRLGLSHWSSVTFIGWLLRIYLRKWDGLRCG